MALCITRSDTKDLNWRKNISGQLTQHSELAPLIKENDIQILFMGCIEPKSGTYYNLSHLFEGYQKVYNMRKKLLEFIIGSEHQQKLLELDLMLQKKEEVMVLIDRLIEGFKFFMTVQDFKSQQVEKRIITHKQDSKTLSESSNAYVNTAELASKFAELVTLAKELKNCQHIPLELRNELVWPLLV